MTNVDDSSLSHYLSHEEIEVLTALLREQHCNARSSALVQVLGTDPPYYDVWIKRCFGVAFFVADCSRRSFYIQVYDPVVGAKLFEQELYKEFVYVSNSILFHQFEGDDQIIGFNFAYEEEASVFGGAIMALLEKRKLKAASMPNRSENESESLEQNKEIKNIQSPVEMRNASYLDKRKRRSRKIRKSEIGNPENFVHVCHVGYNSDKMTSSSTKSQEALLATILELSNIKPRELEDENTKEVFLTFIESNGGLEKVYKRLKSKSSGGFSSFSNTSFFRKRIPTISRPKAILPELAEETPPPANFSGWDSLVYKESTTSSGIKGHKEQLLPPQPPPKELPSLPQGKMETAPPPPPPPQSRKQIPQPPRRHPTMRSVSVPQEIAEKRPIDNEKKVPQQPQEDSASRDDLLNQIRNPGFRLKKVEPPSATEKTTTSGFENSLISSLAQTLEDRSRACRGNSSEEDSESEEGSVGDSDEWD